MSIEYTLDIQLTEMGFPDLIHPQEATVAETPPNSEPSHAPSQKSLPEQHIQPLTNKQQVEENNALTSETQQTRSTVDAPGTRAEVKKLTAAQAKAAKKARLATEASSDDSDVSYMDDEIDDDDDDDFCEDEEEEDSDEEAGNFPCSVCGLPCSSMFKLQDHMNLHTGARPYYCAECGKRFSQIRNYRTHLRTHARAKTRQIKCRICLRRFVNETDLNYHLTMNHFEDKFYECDRCKRVFANLQACQHHIEFSCMRKVTCEHCGHHFPKEKLLKRHLENKTCYSSLKCTECPLVFTKKNELLKHSFSHLGLLPYTCVRCRCHFRLARLYLRHKCKPQSIHCVACLREFLNDHDFQQHKKDTGCWGNQDAKGDEIRCLECGQRFDTKEDLKKHGGAHQRVLKCAECGKGFRSALLLMSHMGGHAGQSPCLCQRCGLGFPHQQSFDIHLKTCGQTPQAPKPSKKVKSTQTSKQKASSSKPTPQDISASPSPSGKEATTPTSPSDSATGTGSVTGEPTQCEANPAVSEVRTAAPEHTEPEKSTVETSSGTLRSSASPRSENTPKEKSPKSNQETQDNPDDPSKGCWKLSLDNPPPAGVNLLLFLPVTQNQSTNLILPCAVPQMGVQSSSGSNGLAGELQLSAVSGAGGKEERNPEPLDLSMKSSLEHSPNKSLVPRIKKEAERVDVSAPTKSSEGNNVMSDSTSERNKHVDNSGLPLSTPPLPTDSVAPKRIKTEPGSDL